MNNEDRRNTYDVVSIPSYESLPEKSESSHPSQDAIQITSHMVFNLDTDHIFEENSYAAKYNAPTPPASRVGSSMPSLDLMLNIKKNLFSPQLMIVFEAGDINCAIHFLMSSVQDPFAPNAVVTVLVEKCIEKEFVERIQAQMQPLSDKVATHPNYLDTLEALEKLEINTIKANAEQMGEGYNTPLIVRGCQHSMLGESVTGVTCLQFFSSEMEAIELCQKESFQFVTVSIWNENIEGLYQFAVALDCSTFYFNCCNVTLSPILSGDIDMCIADGFHYEKLQINEQKTNKIIVFPFGDYLLKKKPQPLHVKYSPIFFLNE